MEKTGYFTRTPLKRNRFCRHTGQKSCFRLKGVTRRHERFQTSFRERSFLLLKEGNFSAFFLYTLISFAGGLLAIGLGYLAAR